MAVHVGNYKLVSACALPVWTLTAFHQRYRNFRGFPMFSPGWVPPQQFYTKTTMRYWPGDSVDSNTEDDIEYRKLPSQRAQSALDYIESPDFSRSIIVGCAHVFATYPLFSFFFFATHFSKHYFISSIPRWHFVRSLGAEKTTRKNDPLFLGIARALRSYKKDCEIIFPNKDKLATYLIDQELKSGKSATFFY